MTNRYRSSFASPSLGRRARAVIVLAGATGLLCGLPTVPAVAAPSPMEDGGAPNGDSLAEVVVTARKREERLQDIPVSVTALGAQQIEELGISSLADVARYTPGLTYDEGISRLDTRPAIRGLYVQRGRPSVAILVDGFDVTTESIVSAGGGALLNQNLLDVERIEVVEGPQSVLYGRSAFAGAINYVTREATKDFTGEVNTTVGNYNTYSVFGTVSGPLIANTLLFRLSVESNGNSGYYRNEYTGNKDLGATHGKGISGELEALPNDDLKIRTVLEYSETSERQRAAVDVRSNGQFASYCTNAALSCSTSPTIPYVHGNQTANPNQVDYSSDYPGLHTATYRGTVSVDYNLGWGTLTSLTGALQDRTRLVQDADYEAYAVTPAFFAYENELQDLYEDTTQLSEELRLASNGDSKLKWLGGLLYYYEDAQLHDSTQYVLDHANPLNPLARTTPTYDSAVLSPTKLDRRTNHESAFGSLGYEIAPKLNLTGEVRVAYEALNVSKPFQSRTSISTYTGGITYGPGGAPEGITYVAGTLYTTYIDPRVTLDYRIDPDHMVYLTWSKGTKPGGYSLLNISNTALTSQKYGAEKLYSWEVGTKTDWLDHKLRINADAYFNNYLDQQVNLANTAVIPPISSVGNAGQVYGFGEELSISYRPITPLTLDLTYSHIHEYYKTYLSSVANDLEFLPGGNYSGKSLPSVPAHTVTAGVRYEKPIADDLQGFVQTSAVYSSKKYGNQYNTWTFGGAAKEDLQVGLETRKWSALLYVNNVWNNLVPDSAIPYFDLHQDFRNTALLYLPDPRTFGLRAGVKF